MYNIQQTIKTVIFIFTLLLIYSCKSKSKVNHVLPLQLKTKTELSAYQLLSRVVSNSPKKKILFKEIKIRDTEEDFFRISNLDGGKILIEGNNGVSMASGLNWYIEKYCHNQISLNSPSVVLPESLPALDQTVQKTTPFEYRYFFNFCTYGYTMPWWDFEKWEEMIDYLALKGVNIPLATIGQEAVWKEVYLEMGFTREELDKFFVGPAHLPWGRMGNIDGLAGPLPDNWIKKRKSLQKKILKRMRSLGMRPVLSAFTGHVPETLNRIYPSAKVYQIGDWAGIKGTHFLDPNDSLFIEIGTAFIKKQKEIYGTDHLYDADCFIEVDPPQGDPVFLNQLGNKVYQSMSTADPEATWVLQGWFFFFKKDFWNKKRGNAFLTGIPKNKVLLLDLYGEKNPTWDRTDAFYGQPWVWNVICNEDQKVNMSGDLSAMQDQFQRAYTSEKDRNLKGIGVIPEGIGYNAVLQDFVLQKTWDPSPVKLDQWITNYAHKRYNQSNDSAEKAWRYFNNTVYGRTRTMWSPLLLTPKLSTFDITDTDSYDWDFDVEKFALGVAHLLDARETLSDHSVYRFDVTNTCRELFSALAHSKIHNLTTSFNNRDTVQFESSAKALLQLIDNLDDITGTNTDFLLGNWIKDARSWGETKEEKDFYEWNARTIVTIWQPYPEGALRDYAAKQWNGLLRGYYKPRWNLFIKHLRKDLMNIEPYSQKKYDLAVRKMDYQWTRNTEKYPSQPTGNTLEVCTELFKKYRKEFLK